MFLHLPYWEAQPDYWMRRFWWRVSLLGRSVPPNPSEHQGPRQGSGARQEPLATRRSPAATTRDREDKPSSVSKTVSTEMIGGGLHAP